MQFEIARFHDDEVDCIRSQDGKGFVVVKPICVNLDLAFPPQYRKLKSVSWSGVTTMVTPDRQGRPQSHIVIPVDSLPMWMATIKEGKVAEHVRSKLRRYQREASDVLARHFLGEPKPSIVSRPWSERFKATMQPHVRHVNIYHPGCFTVLTTLAISLLSLEDELLRHMFELSPSDRPDGSVGQCWANERRRRGLPAVTKEAPLCLPDCGYEVNLRVYDNHERGACEHWFHTTYLPTKMPGYLWRKPSFKRYGELAVASVAENTCQSITGSSARLKPWVRKQLVQAGGFCPAGYSPPALPSPQLTLFDKLTPPSAA